MARTKSTPRQTPRMFAGRTTVIHSGGHRGAMKRTTKKGAYKKTAKKYMVRRRQPMVETKHQTDVLVSAKSGNLTGTAVDELRITTEPLQISYGTGTGSTAVGKELTLFPITSFMNMNQGFDTSDMIGNSIFSKYLKCKLEFQLPYGGNQIRHPCDMWLIHGFITQPIGNTLHTMPEQGDFTRTNYLEHIQEQLEQYFNQRSDKLDYIPKRTSNVKFLGYRKLKVKKAGNLGPPPVAQLDSTNIYGAGSHPLINMTVTWPTMRKIHYEKGTAGTTNTPLEFYYPNYAWLPFVGLYNPTAKEFLSTVTYPGSTPGSLDSPKMFVRYNSIHYWTDS